MWLENLEVIVMETAGTTMPSEDLSWDERWAMGLWRLCEWLNNDLPLIANRLISKAISILGCWLGVAIGLLLRITGVSFTIVIIIIWVATLIIAISLYPPEDNYC
ncbi:hypothetical protein A3K24_00580 [candidate division Kazan bacterium RIFCSPHIGHO2_01_FULL_44_14]|uniref:Uncharacterized protein n=1 Tax=candidate division Kazan bacterium RIFCSPLOWO2_01_FULL_45_19 TaxID=1798538 RepID=A0A1F4NPH9_UNCK3|nr:MAG: hypothetical protein A3K51_00580 [candidate division Kazan bacterium RIFCSPLOWO2_01_FULL_45_19]OGB77606.1 MAG: hypothetical protein A3K24_00580 [candidate division Kazan bacterium RIFCSPHIGHO2_01_FULL_44_14]